jgi:hypothetical protein
MRFSWPSDTRDGVFRIALDHYWQDRGDERTLALLGKQRSI